MDKATAVEVAHQIQELLKTRDAIQKLEQGVKEVIVPDAVEVTIVSDDGIFKTVSIPPHVMRLIVQRDYLLDACITLEKAHGDQLRDLAGITVEEDL